METFFDEKKDVQFGSEKGDRDTMDNGLINFTLKKEWKEFCEIRNLFDEVADDYIACCFDRHGHGAELAEEMLREQYAAIPDKKFAGIMISILIAFFEKKGFWVQATELRERLEDLRNIPFEQSVKNKLHRLKYPNGDSWTDDYGVLHGELVVKL